MANHFASIMLQATERRLVRVPLNTTEHNNCACRNAKVINKIGTISLKLGWGKAEKMPTPKPIYSRELLD